MKETRSIIAAFKASQLTGKKAALVTLVHVEGSSYRRPGARMLVTDDGEMTGAISGGCLEGDALRKALLVLSQQQSRLVTYDTSDEDDATIGVQLGCAGIIQVLMEPIQADVEGNPVALLEKASSKRQSFVLVTGFSLNDKKRAQTGTCLVVEQNGTISGNLPDELLRSAILEDVSIAFTQKKSAFRTYETNGNRITAFIEFVPPAISLVIVGAGNDVMPVAAIADTLGWDCRVIDGRPALAKQERFLTACQVIVTRPEHALAQIAIDDHTVFVLMTHNYNYDLAMLKALIQTDINYIGILGPRKKLERMLNDLALAGITPTEIQLGKLYGPVGLDIGAETAEEIALSVISEIKAVFAGKDGQSLRNRQNMIHGQQTRQLTEKKIT